MVEHVFTDPRTHTALHLYGDGLHNEYAEIVHNSYFEHTVERYDDDKEAIVVFNKMTGEQVY